MTEGPTVATLTAMSSASSLTDQLQAWGTAIAAMVALAALIAAIAAYRTQSGQLRLQQRQLNEQAEVMELQATELRASIRDRERAETERRRAQAVHVYIVEEIHEHVGERGRPVRRPRATVRNASQLPIHDPQIVWHEGDVEVGAILPPYLAPGDGASHDYIGVDGTDGGAPTGVFATARFRDAAGSHWEISAHGNPRLVDTADSPGDDPGRAEHPDGGERRPTQDMADEPASAPGEGKEQTPAADAGDGPGLA
jgi:hypothetical protein